MRVYILSSGCTGGIGVLVTAAVLSGRCNNPGGGNSRVMDTLITMSVFVAAIVLKEMGVCI